MRLGDGFGQEDVEGIEGALLIFLELHQRAFTSYGVCLKVTFPAFNLADGTLQASP